VTDRQTDGGTDKGKKDIKTHGQTSYKNKIEVAATGVSTTSRTFISLSVEFTWRLTRNRWSLLAPP